MLNIANKISNLNTFDARNVIGIVIYYNMVINSVRP